MANKHNWIRRRLGLEIKALGRDHINSKECWAVLPATHAHANAVQSSSADLGGGTIQTQCNLI